MDRFVSPANLQRFAIPAIIGAIGGGIYLQKRTRVYKGKPYGFRAKQKRLKAISKASRKRNRPIK